MKIKIKWLCSNAIGSPYWQTIDIYECDECGYEFYEEEDIDNEEELKYLYTECPKCHQELSYKTDNPEIIKE